MNLPQPFDNTIYERVQAIVKFYSRDKKFGFLKRPNKPDIFFSAKELENSNINHNTVSPNDVFEFDLIPVQGRGGKARNMKLITKAKNATNKS